VVKRILWRKDFQQKYIPRRILPTLPQDIPRRVKIRDVQEKELKRIRPPKINYWNLKMNYWKRKFLFKTIIFRFHVNLRGCMSM